MEDKIILKITGINKKRDTNDIIYYDRTHSSTTQCNGWGFELAIDKNNVIIETNSLISSIPEDGYAISAHGEENVKLFIENFKVGQKCSFCKETMEFAVFKELDKKDYYDIKINELKTRYKDALDNLKNIDYSVEYDIENIEKAKNNGDSNLDELIFEASLKLFPSRMIENRGVWHRPIEKNKEEVLNTLNNLKEANISSIYLEADVDSYLIIDYLKYKKCPTLSGVYSGYKDYLTCFITEAHKLGMEVFLWDKVIKVPEIIYNDYPDWQLLYYNNKNYIPLKKDDLTFFDPAIKEVQNFLLKKIDYYLSNYNFDGYEMDYIRYPRGNRYIEESSGYSKQSIEGFEKLYNTSIEDNYELYKIYRRDILTNFVNRIISMIRSNYPRVKVAISVFSSVDEALFDKLQNWPEWVKENKIDIVNLMAYYFDESAVKKDASTLNNFSEGKAFSYVGLAPSYSHLPVIENAKHINGARDGKCNGQMIFYSANITNEVKHVLRNSVYRLKSVRPHDDNDVVIKAMKDELDYLYKNIYVPKKRASKLERTRLHNTVDLIKYGPDYIRSLNFIKTFEPADEIVKRNIFELVDYVINIFKIKENHNR